MKLRDWIHSDYSFPQTKSDEKLEKWLKGWEAAVLDGQSSISREEAIKRYHKWVEMSENNQD